jgi:hypothetical protein
VRAVAVALPDALCARLDAADTLSDADRAEIVGRAREALAGFVKDAAEPTEAPTP